MTNSKIHAALAIGCLVAFGAFVAFLPPVPPASAQSQAERICREQGVKINTEGYEYCLSQATRAVEWGEPALARSFAPRGGKVARGLPVLRPEAADTGLQGMHRQGDHRPRAPGLCR